ALNRLLRGSQQPKFAASGLRWLLSLQNRDGGMPTFCRGWGRLPFDRSGCDLTANALRAFSHWARRKRPTSMTKALLHPQENRSVEIKGSKTARAIKKGLRYIARHQRPDGSWLPLWFGNQHAPNEENPTYGTARVL